MPTQTDLGAQVVFEVVKSYPALIVLLLVLRALAGFIIEKLYPDLKTFLQEALAWHRAQLALYMERDRQVIVENAKQRVFVASKWQELNTPNGVPPAPG